MRWKSDLILLFVAALWGTGFVAQRLAIGQLNAFYYNGGRFLIAALVIFLLTRFQRRAHDAKTSQTTRKYLRWMILAGSLLFAGASLQQIGLESTSIGNASFITGLYLVIIPLILFIFFRQQIHWISWAAVAIATAGILLLSMQGEFKLAPGDALELIGALLWACHVILVGRLAERGVNVLWFSVIQFTTAGLLNLVVALGLDPQGASSLLSGWAVIVYSALFPIGLGFTLQIAGQKHAPPVDAAILLSMEAVFGTLFGYLFLRELLTTRQVMGCVLIFAAMILSQVRPVEVLEAERV